jgi:hypothetical protein
MMSAPLLRLMRYLGRTSANTAQELFGQGLVVNLEDAVNDP